MKYTVESLRQFGIQVAEKAGMSHQDAETLLKNLLFSDMRGVRSHGMTRLSGYVTRIERGCTSATAQPTITMDSGAVFTATALASAIATLLMAAFSNYPFVLAPGMGLNAYFAYTVVLNMGYSWQIALMAVFVEGIIFIILSLTNVREAIFDAIPLNLKKAVSVGIGLFIAFIGLQNAGLVNDSESTLVTITDFTSNFHTAGICALLAVIGVFQHGF